MQKPVNWQRRTLVKAIAAGSLVPVTGFAANPSMMTRRIPATGEPLPVVGLGTWQTLDISGPQDMRAARQTLQHFVELGGTVIDSSPMYGQSESVVGRLAGELNLAGRLFLASKVWTTGREAGARQMEESMRRMGTRRIDLMQIHNLVDGAIHVKTLRDWKAGRRIRYWGISHYHAGAYGEVERFIKTERPDFLQINYSLAEPDSGERLLPLARDLGIAVIANRPFAEGALFRRVEGKELPAWATEFDAVSWAQFFLKWILGNPVVTCAIPATRNPAYLIDNMGAGRGRLPDTEMRKRMAAFLQG